MNADRSSPRKLRRQSSSHLAYNCCLRGCGRPFVYVVIFLMACCALAYQYKGLILCLSWSKSHLQQQNYLDLKDTSKISSDLSSSNFRSKHSSSPKREVAVSKEFIRSLFDLWKDALLTGDSEKVAKCYASHATLLPTLSNTPRNDYESIKDYFDQFLHKQPEGRIVQGIVQLGDDGTWAQDSGIYEFRLGIDGSVVRARYSFIYQKLAQEDDEHQAEWKIVHHHSSLMPER
ncbi:calcium/calmodulin dependent protein kinase II association-domain containing protein [Nitzschia inconspicua]|uniref:Calcium/calmodulin dependent protein kinase II association-domain containing protein n=1 Tax=Nitzschia inconspicua TaxID=303405 RepID=A0A9K3KML8_9STRA|nr:calcium/calmodulin dependent protein kinase II association-domain containing protein [Nitzschia inconspicua]